MKLSVKCEKKEIGTLQVSTIPSVSHSFELNKKRYEIIKTSKDSIEVTEIASKQKIEDKPGSPGEKPQ